MSCFCACLYAFVLMRVRAFPPCRLVVASYRMDTVLPASITTSGCIHSSFPSSSFSSTTSFPYSFLILLLFAMSNGLRGLIGRGLGEGFSSQRGLEGVSWQAEVTGGGVPLEDIDCRTMESRLLPRVYLCGEILDVFGRVGGTVLSHRRYQVTLILACRKSTDAGGKRGVQMLQQSPACLPKH